MQANAIFVSAIMINPMDYKEIQPHDDISLFVRSIMVFEGDADKKTVLPFFADGYPGLLFFESDKGLKVHPHDKQMPQFFIYGQTLEPLELVFETGYRMIVFQFYPFILKSLFNVDPKTINDNCYNLLELGDPNIRATVSRLKNTAFVDEWAGLITQYLFRVFAQKQKALDITIKEALLIISENLGQVAIAEVCGRIGVNKRTFERRFAAETGLLPKQFAKIMQFQSSLKQLSEKDYDKLTDIVYENGFSDQSHFIKVFKAYTGKTPKAFSKM